MQMDWLLQHSNHSHIIACSIKLTGVFVIFQQSFTTLGVALAKVELNEANFSEVLRLFVLSRNAGDPHPVRGNN